MLLLNPFTFAPPYDQKQRYGPRAQNPQKRFKGSLHISSTFNIQAVGYHPHQNRDMPYIYRTPRLIGNMLQWTGRPHLAGSHFWNGVNTGGPHGSAIPLILEYYCLSLYNGLPRILKDLCAAADSYCSFQLAFCPNLTANQKAWGHIPCPVHPG